MLGDGGLVIQSCVIVLKGSFSIHQAIKCLKGRQAFKAVAHPWNESKSDNAG